MLKRFNLHGTLGKRFPRVNGLPQPRQHIWRGRRRVTRMRCSRSGPHAPTQDSIEDLQDSDAYEVVPNSPHTGGALHPINDPRSTIRIARPWHTALRYIALSDARST